ATRSRRCWWRSRWRRWGSRGRSSWRTSSRRRSRPTDPDEHRGRPRVILAAGASVSTAGTARGSGSHMRSSRPVLPVIVLGLGLGLGLGALASPAAAAQRVELAGKVTASRTVLAQRRVGEARYIAISDLFYRDRAAVVEVLDLSTRSVIQVAAKRAVFERRFGVSRGGSVAVPQGDVVVYRDGVVGLALASAAVISPRRYWYAELDARTGKLLRVADLAALRDGEQLEVIGTDADGG